MSSETVDPDPELLAQKERRQHPRVKLAVSPLLGRRVTGGETFVVEEASASGFSMTGSTSFAHGTSYQFRVWSTADHVTVVVAVCRYCTLIERENGPWTYRSGFQFLPQSGRRLRVILGALAMNAP